MPRGWRRRRSDPRRVIAQRRTGSIGARCSPWTTALSGLVEGGDAVLGLPVDEVDESVGDGAAVDFDVGGSSAGAAEVRQSLRTVGRVQRRFSGAEQPILVVVVSDLR